MANMIVPLTSIESSITNDIFYSIIHDVGSFIRIDPKTIKILINSMEVSKTDLENNAIFNRENNTPRSNYEGTFTVKVTEEFDGDSVGTTAINRRDQFPIFRDTDVGVSIAPIYGMNNLTFEFTYEAGSKSEISDMRNRLRSNLSRSMNMLEHTVEYSMILPKFVEEFMYDTHKLKSRLFPIDIESYLKFFASPQLHPITDMSNRENTLFAVKEVQTGVFGVFDFEDSPPESDNDSMQNTHKLSFSYRVQMEIPREVTLNFPPMICNRLIDDRFIQILEDHYNERLDFRTNEKLNLGRSNTVMSYFRTDRINNRLKSFPYPINVPVYDSYSPHIEIPGYGTIMTVLCQVEEEDGVTLINLKELGDWMLPKKVLNYIRDNARKVTSLYQSFIYIGLERMGTHFGDTGLIITDSLDVKLKEPLSLMLPIRITIRILTDFSFLNEVALNDLMKDDAMYPYVINEMVDTYTDFDIGHGDTAIYRNNSFLKVFFDKVIELVDKGDDAYLITLFRIVSQHDKVVGMVTDELINAHPETYQTLLGRSIIFITSKGGYQMLEPNPNLVREQLNNALNYFNDNVQADSYGHYQRSLDGRLIPKTVMNYSIVSQRSE